MDTFTIGGDLEVHRLGFGAMRITGEGIWGPPDDPEEAKRLLRRVPELGIDLIDTADSYGPEVSENLIAEALHPYPDGLVIATKGGLRRTGPGQWPRDARPERLKECCEASLRRLKLDRIDLYQLHSPDPQVPYEDSVGALKELQDEGKIRHVGISNVSLEELAQARGIVEVVTVQNRYNLTDRHSEDVLEACEEAGIGFIPWFPLATGRLAEPGGAARQGRQGTRRDPRADRARVAARALAGDAADSRDVLGRAPRGERGGHADRALAARRWRRLEALLRGKCAGMTPTFAPTSLDHVALWVDDREPLATFLCDHLGMHVIEETDTFTLVGIDAKLGKLTLFDADGPRQRGALERIVLRVADLDSVLAALPFETTAQRRRRGGVRGARRRAARSGGGARARTSTSTTWCSACSIPRPPPASLPPWASSAATTVASQWAIATCGWCAAAPRTVTARS